MKNVLTFSAAFLTLTAALSAQTVAVHTVLVQGFLDDANPVRFSPLNLLDADPASVYAVTFAKTDPVKPLVTLNLAEPVKLDGLRIRAGWFDEKQFKAYQRAKQVKVWVKQPSGALVPAQVFPLKDQMVAQDLMFTKPVDATAVYLSVPESFPGSKNKDLVLSSLEGLAAGQVLALERTDHGSLVLTVTEEVLSLRDDQSRLVYQSTRTRGDAADRLTRILTYRGSSPAAARESFLGPDGLWQEAWDLAYDGDSVVRKVLVASEGTKKSVQTVSFGGVPVLERETISDAGASVEILYQFVGVEPLVRVPVTSRAAADSAATPVISTVTEGSGVQVVTRTWTN